MPLPAPLHTLIADGSDAFLSGMIQWISSCPDLQLVGTARNGPEALDAVSRLAPDLVILEAGLPGIDGFRLTRTLKSRPGAPLVVLVTFHASAAARAEARAAGADALLATPDFTDGLEAILEEWAKGKIVAVEPVTTPTKPARRGSQTVPDP